MDKDQILDSTLTGTNAVVTSGYGLTLLFEVDVLSELPEAAATAAGLTFFGVGFVKAYKMFDDR